MKHSLSAVRQAGMLVVGLLLTGVFYGCDEGAPTAPTADDVAGAYVATRLAIEHDGQWLDALAMGGELVVTLHENGTLEGSQFLPEELSGTPGGATTELAGTWFFYYSLIELNPTESPTVVDGVQFTMGPDLLDARYPRGITERLRITLTRTD